MPTRSKSRRRVVVIAAVLGAALGVACSYVPPDYQVACHAVSRIIAACSGSFT